MVVDIAVGGRTTLSLETGVREQSLDGGIAERGPGRPRTPVSAARLARHAADWE